MLATLEVDAIGAEDIEESPKRSRESCFGVGACLAAAAARLWTVGGSNSPDEAAAGDSDEACVLVEAEGGGGRDMPDFLGGGSMPAKPLLPLSVSNFGLFFAGPSFSCCCCVDDTA